MPDDAALRFETVIRTNGILENELFDVELWYSSRDKTIISILNIDEGGITDCKSVDWKS